MSLLQIRLLPEEKLDLLRYLDEFHFWQSLDDRRLCTRCHKRITGRQIEVFEESGSRREMRVQCPTEKCDSTPADWNYEDPLAVAKQPCGLSFLRAASDRESNN